MKKVFIVIITIFLFSCGLEDFPVIDPLDLRTWNYKDISEATIGLPSSTPTNGYDTYFDNFIIFYKIYVSTEIIVGKIEQPAERSAINATLASDYNSLNPYTDITSTSVSTSNLETTFSNRGYYKLLLEGANINSVLGSGSTGKTLLISFEQNNTVKPTLSLLDGTNVNGPYVLWRAVEGPGFSFDPKPDRYFQNHTDLHNTQYTNKENNADLIGATGSRYAYVSMYIAALGRSFDVPPSSIYSQPAFLGIFSLPEKY